MTPTKPYVYNENPQLFWGDEVNFVINALNVYAETRIEEIKQIEANGKIPLFAAEYINDMTEHITQKILHLQQPKAPKEKEDE
jgi:hypothetical protein